MGEFLYRMFRSDFMPHGFCWKWEPWVVWTNVMADLFIFLCYLIIGSTLLKVAAKRKDVISNPVVVLFGAFILCCGCTHAMEVFNTWNGFFRLAGAVKVVTAGVSLLTVGPLMDLLPKLLAVPALSDVLNLNAALHDERRENDRMAGRLRESEDCFRLLVEGIRDYAIFLVDAEGLITSWNPGGQKAFGYRDRDILGQPLIRLYPPEDVAAGLPAQVLRKAAEMERQEDEGWRIRKDGSRFLAKGVLTAFYGPAGRVKGFAWIIQDITEQRANQAALEGLAERLEDQVKERVRELRESQARLEAFIQHSPAAIAFKDLDGRYVLINPRMEEAFCRPASSILGRTDADLLTQPSCSRAQAREEAILRSGQSFQGEEGWAPGGRPERDYLVNAFPLENPHGKVWGLGVIATDITERKESDRAMLQSQKLESLGVLAGGIAHDFNNLLGAVQGNLELALMEDSVPFVRPYLETIGGLVARGTDLLKQLLAYSGRGKFVVGEVGMNRLVTGLTQLLGTSISKKAVIQLDLDPALPSVEGDASQFQQVVMNLVINASEAIGDQPGTIRITTRQLVLEPEDMEAYCMDPPCRPGLYVSLEVSDTGKGMTAEVRKRIFEPFFTTKFTGRGLGLAATHGIVRGHKGAIHVLSEPGRGSAFRILLPAALGAPGGAAPTTECEPLGAAGDILVVDDEQPLRAMIARALDRAGFHPLQAGNGQEALGAFWANPRTIRLIVMDLTMPVMDGLEACRELRRKGVDIPILLMSGFDETESLCRSEGLGLAGFLQKPFPLAALLGRVRSLLEG